MDQTDLVLKLIAETKAELTFYSGLNVYSDQVLLGPSVCGVGVCVYSNSRNDVSRVAQRYGTIAAHTRRRASVLVACVVFCVHMYKFCRFDKADATADVQ